MSHTTSMTGVLHQLGTLRLVLVLFCQAVNKCPRPHSLSLSGCCVPQPTHPPPTIHHPPGALAAFSAEVFRGILKEADATNERVNALGNRVTAAVAGLPAIDAAARAGKRRAAADRGGRIAHTERTLSQLFTRETRPQAVKDLYEDAEPRPALNELDEFNPPGAPSCMSLFSNPGTCTAFPKVHQLQLAHTAAAPVSRPLPRSSNRLVHPGL